MGRQATARADDVGPTREFRRHHVVTDDIPVEGKAGEFCCRVEDPNRLRLYLLGDWLDERQVLAGERLHEDWFNGRPVPSVVGGYESPVDGGGRLPDGDEEAERRYREARRAMASRDARVVERVALHNECLFEWAGYRRQFLTFDQAKAMLIRGLDALADHYGL